MRRGTIIKTGITAIITAIISYAGGVQAQTGSQTELREELGVARMLPVNPEAGQTIPDPRPWIVADFSALDREIDAGSVQVLLDGRNITALCDINIQYAACELGDDMAAGGHDVIVTARDKQGTPFPTLGWRFTIAIEGMTSAREKTDRTTGRIVASLESVQARFTPNPLVDVEGQFERPEGINFEDDIYFINTRLGGTLSGALSREVQNYGGLELDQGRVNYVSAPEEGWEVNAGDFWAAWTPLSLKGTQFRGMEYKDKTRWGSWSLVSGRSQDPSTSGSYKEYGGGIQASIDTSENHTVTISALTSDEEDDASLAAIRGSRTRSIGSIHNRWSISEAMEVSAELAMARIEEQGLDAETSGAWEVEARYRLETWELRAKGFRYGTDFYPVAEGSSQNLTNDKRGYSVGLGLNPTQLWSLGGDFELYDSIAGGGRRFEKNAEYVSFRPRGYSPNVTLRHSGLSVTGAVRNDSSTDLALLTWTLPGTRFTGESRFTALWQVVEFSGLLTGGAAIETRSRQRFYSFNTNIMSKANISWDRSDGNSVARTSGTRSKTRAEHVAVALTLIPFKLLLDLDWGLDRGTGTTADTRRRERGIGARWFANDLWTFSLEFGRVDYTDRMNPFYGYDQDIVKLEVERRF